MNRLLLLTLLGLFGLTGTTCITGCVGGSSTEGPDFFVRRSKPPAVRAYKHIFGAGVEIDTAFSGATELDEDGKLRKIEVNSDPVVVEEARRETAIALESLLEKRWASIERREERNLAFADRQISNILGFAGVLIGQGRDPAPAFDAVAQLTAGATGSPIAGSDELNTLLKGLTEQPDAISPTDADPAP